MNSKIQMCVYLNSILMKGIVYELLLSNSLFYAKRKGQEVKVKLNLLVNEEHKDHNKIDSLLSIFLKHMYIVCLCLL